MLIRVDDEPPRTRLEYLRHVVADTIVRFGVSIDGDRDLRARILTARLGPVHLTKISAPPMRAFRGDGLIRAADPELFKIDVQVRGRAVVEQGGREAALAPGDFTLVNLSRPCRLAEGADEHEVLAVKFPRTALPLRQNELDGLTAVAMSGRYGLGAPISSLALHIARRLGDHGSTDGGRLATALMDLLVVMLADRLDRIQAIAPATRRRALVASVQNYIDRRLSDPELSPAAIAAAHHVSVRHLHKLFETEQATVAGWIRQRRLERCRRDLLDPGLSHWSVSAIAARWGFIDPAHFSRIFRAAHGLPPSKFRQKRLH